jgi:hypothetical protein
VDTFINIYVFAATNLFVFIFFGSTSLLYNACFYVPILHPPPAPWLESVMCEQSHIEILKIRLLIYTSILKLIPFKPERVDS